MAAKQATAEYGYKPPIVTNARGEQVDCPVPVTRRQVLDRVNKAVADDRQRVMFDGDRVVWIDLRAAKEIDLEEYARRHGHMERSEKMVP